MLLKNQKLISRFMLSRLDYSINSEVHTPMVSILAHEEVSISAPASDRCLLKATAILANR
jgi:hypothetical protein